MKNYNEEIDDKIMKAIAGVRNNIATQKMNEAGRKLSENEQNRIIIETNLEIEDSLKRVVKVFNKKMTAILLSATLGIGGVAGGAIGYNIGKDDTNIEGITESGEGNLTVDDGIINITGVNGEDLQVNINGAEHLLINLEDASEEQKLEYIKIKVEEEKQIINSLKTKEDVMNHMAEMYAQRYEEITDETLDPEKLDFVLMPDMAINKDGGIVRGDAFCVKYGLFETLETAMGTADRCEHLSGDVNILSEYDNGYSVYASLWGLAEDIDAGNKDARSNDTKAFERYKAELCEKLGIEKEVLEEALENDTRGAGRENSEDDEIVQ